MLQKLTTAIVELDRDAVPALVTQRLEAGDDPLEILGDCRTGMTMVGERFQEGEYFLGELLVSAELFKQAVELLDPHLVDGEGDKSAGVIVLATMRGDIHDLGKNIFATLLRAHSFEVHDLGVNIEPTQLVDEVQQIKPDFVGFSSLITTSFDSTRQAIEMLEDKGLRAGLKLMLGGGVTTPGLAKHLGVDFQTLDAASGVTYCLEKAAAAEA
ncbi:MAG: cobalamin-dependent protein [Deltaproteobacteria bacterium]|nr:cobalamin-dependent protein [Deltaproteobacteria bacterium]MBW2400453.1 cobalamin-dependent protein [Deltaproteobacteria bacterium]